MLRREAAACELNQAVILFLLVVDATHHLVTIFNLLGSRGHCGKVGTTLTLKATTGDGLQTMTSTGSGTEVGNRTTVRSKTQPLTSVQNCVRYPKNCSILAENPMVGRRY